MTFTCSQPLQVFLQMNLIDVLDLSLIIHYLRGRTINLCVGEIFEFKRTK